MEHIQNELTEYRLDELMKQVTRIEALLVAYDERTQRSVDKLGERVGATEIGIACVQTEVKRFYWLVGLAVPITGIIVGVVTSLLGG